MANLMMSKYTEHYVDPERWHRALAKQIPDLDFRVWPDVGDYESIEMVLGDFAPPGLLKQFPNLKLISYLGYGVDDALFKDPELPKTVAITRIGSLGIAVQVVSRVFTQYVVLYLLRHHRLLPTYERSVNRLRRCGSRSNPSTLGVATRRGLGARPNWAPYRTDSWDARLSRCRMEPDRERHTRCRVFSRCGVPFGNPHVGEIITHAPNLMWGTDRPRAITD